MYGGAEPSSSTRDFEGCYAVQRKKQVYCLLCGVTTCSVHIPLLMGTKDIGFMKENSSISMGEQNCISSDNEFSWLDEFGPKFGVSAKNIKILHEPSQFYQKLKECIQKAGKRITLASLYIGTGPLEEELISCLHSALEKSDGKVKAKVLVDFTRGSRGQKNTRTLLLPLLRDFPCDINVALYHTPSLRGWIRTLLPERWNETISLTHLKVYLFDNTIILSGANLSDQYFTNRQDRYIIFENCSNLADYFDSLVNTVSTFSFQLRQDNSIVLHQNWSIHPYEGDKDLFIEKANQKLEKYTTPEYKPKSIPECNGAVGETQNEAHKDQNEIDTWIYPLLQMHPLRIRQDENITQLILMKATPNSTIKLASGYFNLTDQYMDIIIQGSLANYDILMASPQVNGFYGASGVAGSIPSAYTYIAKKFYERLQLQKEETRVKLMEYYKDKWTFHVKGLWYYLPGEKLPSLSLIGSPNFGYRSVYRDLEAQVAIVTHNIKLQEELHFEQQRLYDLSTTVNEETFQQADRYVPLWTKLVTMVVKTYF